MDALSDAGNALSSEITNATDKNTLINHWWYGGVTGAGSETGGYLEIYHLYENPSGTFVYGDATVDPGADSLVGTMIPRFHGTSKHALKLGPVEIMPFDFRVVLRNQSGHAFDNSDNWLSVQIWNPLVE